MLFIKVFSNLIPQIFSSKILLKECHENLRIIYNSSFCLKNNLVHVVYKDDLNFLKFIIHFKITIHLFHFLCKFLTKNFKIVYYKKLSQFIFLHRFIIFFLTSFLIINR